MSWRTESDRKNSQTYSTAVEIRVMLYSVAVCEAIRALEDAMDQKKQCDRVSYEERAREIQCCLLASQDSLKRRQEYQGERNGRVRADGERFVVESGRSRRSIALKRKGYMERKRSVTRRMIGTRYGVSERERD